MAAAEAPRDTSATRASSGSFVRVTTRGGAEAGFRTTATISSTTREPGGGDGAASASARSRTGMPEL